MIHLESPLWRVRGKRVGGVRLTCFAILCLATTYQTNHWINAQFERDDIPIAAAAGPAKLAAASYEALPIVLTITIAVAQAQRMEVARAKHHPAKTASSASRSGGLRGAGGLIAGLALLQAMHSHGGQ
jgi:TRAP-type C4-dicarboxylate transport system permease small subunit